MVEKKKMFDRWMLAKVLGESIAMSLVELAVLAMFVGALCAGLSDWAWHAYLWALRYCAPGLFAYLFLKHTIEVGLAALERDNQKAFHEFMEKGGFEP